MIPVSTLDLYARSRIGYNTILPNATVTASSRKTDNPVSLLSNYLTYDAWEANARGEQYIEVVSSTLKIVNYIGLACHNLGSALAPFKLQYYENGWRDAMPEYSVTYNTPVLYEFDNITAKRFRLLITTSSLDVFIGVFFLGEIMHFEKDIGVFVGHAPATYARVDEILNSESEGGQFLGRSTISEGGATTINLGKMSSDFVRSTWVPFQNHARLRPFFFAWDPYAYPSEVIYGWSTSTPKPVVGGHYWYDVSIGMKGIVGHVEDES